jgi:hypothetical protein
LDPRGARNIVGEVLKQPHSKVDNSRIEVKDKIVGFDSMRRRKSLRTRDHDSDLVVPEWDTGQEVAGMLHARAGPDAFVDRRTMAQPIILTAQQALKLQKCDRFASL